MNGFVTGALVIFIILAGISMLVMAAGVADWLRGGKPDRPLPKRRTKQ